MGSSTRRIRSDTLPANPAPRRTASGRNAGWRPRRMAARLHQPLAGRRQRPILEALNIEPRHPAGAGRGQADGLLQRRKGSGGSDAGRARRLRPGSPRRRLAQRHDSCTLTVVPSSSVHIRREQALIVVVSEVLRVTHRPRATTRHIHERPNPGPAVFGGLADHHAAEAVADEHRGPRERVELAVTGRRRLAATARRRASSRRRDRADRASRRRARDAATAA